MTEQMESKRRIEWRALDIRVLAVAVEGYNREWTAYIGAVKGDNHEKESRDVMDYGSTLPRNVAEVLFPDFAENFEWRG